ncbi:MAG: aminotransferase class III-fold pyridoxal phosphate-dependent enzyme [Desulfobacterales bacterium]|nr:aminotransferase class III-fold pyridoxal phosphate-dependent enzyme [Desulfobacterales bacterium]
MDITPYVEKAKGAYLWDVDGKKYIDYRMAFGPIILGHSYDEVDAKVHRRDRKGHAVCHDRRTGDRCGGDDRRDVPGVEMVRMACSGTEATMHAIRVARAYTGRDIHPEVRGQLSRFPRSHLVVHLRYRPKPTAIGAVRSLCRLRPASRRRCGEFIITLPFNDFEGFERMMRSYGEQIAAVITEPCQGNCGGDQPAGRIPGTHPQEDRRIWHVSLFWMR